MAADVKHEDYESGLAHIVLYIIPSKIQKQRLRDILVAAKKRKFKLKDQFDEDVTHIVTELETTDQVVRALKLDSLADLHHVEVLSMAWFTASMKAGGPVSIQESFRLQAEKKEEIGDPSVYQSTQVYSLPEYACQRITRLQHHNEKFTKALEILEKYAELRDENEDYSRALAFRRASCVLKSLPFHVQNMSQLKHLKDLGGHSKKVITHILDDGSCEEVDKIVDDPWFQKMKLFTSVFGVGPSTAKKWIDRGWNTIEDAQDSGQTSADWRVVWGLAFHKDLNSPVQRSAADFLVKIIKEEAEKLLPGVIVELIGGFRRGKKSGHDIDILLSHPEEGRELGLLARLLLSLENTGLVLSGNHEKSTYSEDVLVRDYKLSMRGQLDHFEKWLGILKLPKNYQTVLDVSSVAAINEAVVENDMKHPVTCGSSDTLEDCEPARKKKRFDSGLSPLDLCKADRDWLARRVDLIVCPFSQYYYALVGWTGSKHFNRDLRLYSQRVLNMKLTSHGLYNFEKGYSIPATSEKEVFDNLKIQFREPEERNC